MLLAFYVFCLKMNPFFGHDGFSVRGTVNVVLTLQIVVQPCGSFLPLTYSDILNRDRLCPKIVDHCVRIESKKKSNGLKAWI